MSLIIDYGTGTMLTAHTCYLVPDDAFTEAEWDDIENFSDSEISRIGRENGRRVSDESNALDIIARTLSESEWTPDMFDAIADLVRATGRTIADL